MAVKKSLKNLKFDEALAMLEEKVKLLEDGSLPLEESLEVFKDRRGAEQNLRKQA